MQKENNNAKLNLDNEMFTVVNGNLISIKKIDKKIIIPEGVETIDSRIFVRMDADEKNKIVKDGKKIEEVVFPSTLKKIHSCAFKSGWGFYCFFDLKNIKLPPSLEYIGANAFSDNPNLESIELNENIKLGSYPFVLSRTVIKKAPLKSKLYVTGLPSKIIINYTSFTKLSKCLDELINSENFKFVLTYVPKFEFELRGPELSKVETLKIYRKIILTRARKATFTNQKMEFDLTDYQQNNVNTEEKEGKSK